MRKLCKVFAVVSMGVCCAAGRSMNAQAFSVQDVLDAPLPSQLTAASRGSTIAWVFAERGSQNVWVATGPDFTPRPVTHYTGDTGQPIASLRLSPDGKRVVYARGTEIDEQGRSANPQSLAVQPKQQVWIADVSNGEPRVLGDMGCEFEGCEDIALSPDGRWAVWETHSELWIASTDNPTAKAKQLTDLRGHVASALWSPDGAHLAVLVNRHDHTLTAILDVRDGTVEQVHYVAPSTGRDMSPRWSPDGAHLAFMRIGGVEQGKALIPQTPTPYSVWVADAHTFVAAPVWKSGNGSRDSLPIFAPDQLLFAAGDTVVFSSEADGRNHLYAVPAKGGAATLLTPGDYDVEEASLTPDKRSILLSTNEEDVDRRHIWSVPVSGSAPPKALFRGETIEWGAVETADGKETFCMGSTAVTPGLIYRLESGQRELVTKNALPKTFPADRLVVPKQVIFQSSDGLTIHGQLFVPKNQTKRGPAIIFTHGGPPRQMLLGFHYMDFYSYSYAENEYLASLGFTVLSVNYRLGTMYGHDFRQAANAGWRGSSEYNDVLAGAHFLQGLPNVDPKRIGLWGGSYGGLLTALGLARNSDIFAVGVDYAGVHDWSPMVQNWEGAGAAPPDLEQAKALAFSSSAVASIDKWTSPVLLVQGDDDRNVEFSQTVSLVQKLRRQGVPFEEIVYPDEIHDMLLWRNITNYFEAASAFLANHLHPEQ